MYILQYIYIYIYAAPPQSQCLVGVGQMEDHAKIKHETQGKNLLLHIVYRI